MVAENYTNTFGGENVSPSNLSYVTYTIEGPISLRWAFEAVSTDYVTADKIDIKCMYANAAVKMPPANQVTVGQDALFGNTDALAYNVTDYDGNIICIVESGVEWFIYLTDNTSQAGVWHATQFGATISSGNAAALAGAGLRASSSSTGVVLDQNLPTTELTASYTLTAADRATVVRNDGGGVTYTLPDAFTVGDGWFAYIVNLGGGNILLQPVGGDTIDEDPDKTVGPDESLIVLSDGGNFQTVGHGRSIDSNITAAGINAAGAGTLVLSSSDAVAQVQDFSGTLTGNRRIEYGAIPGYWFVWNRTDPLSPHTMTFALNAIDPGVVVPQGVLPTGIFSILRSNGTNMTVAFSDAGGSVTSVATSSNLTGGPITTSGTLDLSNTGVTAGTYGDATHSSRVQVDLKGRITTISAPTIAIPASAIIDLSAILLPGTIVQYGGKNAPPVLPPASTIWLPCDGTTRLIVDFPILAGILDNAHGPLTGTTFTLPDTRGRVLAGMDAGTGRLPSPYFEYGHGPGPNAGIVGNAGGHGGYALEGRMMPLHNHGVSATSAISGGAHTHNITRNDDGVTPVNTVFASPSWDSFGQYSGSGSGLQYASWQVTSATPSMTATVTVSQSNQGNSEGHTNIQPTLIIRHLIKT